jgi:hypothetical protein
MPWRYCSLIFLSNLDNSESLPIRGVMAGD